MTQDKLRNRLKMAICALSLVLALSLSAGMLLLRDIGDASFRAGEGDEVYSREQIDKFTTGVLIAVQNSPLSAGTAGADMIFIASFDSFGQRLSVAALHKELLLGGERLSDIYKNDGAGGLVNAVNDSFGLDIKYYACTDTLSLGAMIDLLGGIRVKVDFAEAAYINKALGEGNVKAGRVTLNGSASMVYAMDEISGEEQMGGLKRSLELVESAVMNMRKTATKEAMLPLLSLVSGSIRTNLDYSVLHDIGYEIIKAEEMEYKSICIPADGTWDTDENGMLRVNDLETNKKQLYDGLYKK